jgi:hypothetical protein
VTDVHTGWSEQRAVRCKAQRWVFEAIKEIRGRLPFPLLGIDSDNGGEFINQALLTYCREEMNRLYELLRLRTNFFLPSMKLVEKRRRGSRVHKRYDEARTPCQRVLGCSGVSLEIKRRLRRQHKTLNLAQLHREICEAQKRLEQLVRQVAWPRPPQGLQAVLQSGDEAGERGVYR